MAFLASRVQSGGLDAGGLGQALGQERERAQAQGGLGGGLLGSLLDQDGDGQVAWAICSRSVARCWADAAERRRDSAGRFCMGSARTESRMKKAAQAAFLWALGAGWGRRAARGLLTRYRDTGIA
jgi:hypothetical protein